MQFVSVREFRLGPGRVWARLKKEQDLVVTSRGKPVAILSSAGESSIEDDLAALRRARALAAVDAVQKRSAETGRARLTALEVGAEIKAARRRLRRA
jgi:PHD/YefM family antitoxin component YafN of YafNO toxin-antitoxin module